ncbi:MAG: hypothetical protein R2826_10970 [Thermoleophilia bacterium]
MYHVAADGQLHHAVARGSVLGGRWRLHQSLAAGTRHGQNRPAIAVSGTTAVVVGQCSTSVAWGTGQIVLGYTY